VIIRAGIAEEAGKVEKMLAEASSFIEQNTHAVCPHCVSVCCINRHGRYEEDDLRYLHAAGLTPVPLDGADYAASISCTFKDGVATASCSSAPIDDAAPCIRLGREGCTLPRALRPFRCNWYFCIPLLEHMSGGPQRPYRRFMALFGELVTLRGEMLDECRRLERAASG
jgi:hypothetical protein